MPILCRARSVDCLLACSLARRRHSRWLPGPARPPLSSLLPSGPRSRARASKSNDQSLAGSHSWAWPEAGAVHVALAWDEIDLATGMQPLRRTGFPRRATQTVASRPKCGPHWRLSCCGPSALTNQLCACSAGGQEEEREERARWAKKKKKKEEEEQQQQQQRGRRRRRQKRPRCPR